MAEEASPASLARLWWSRLAGRSMMLLAAVVVLAGLLLAGQIQVLAAVVAFIALASGAALLPGDEARLANLAARSAEGAAETTAIRHFADALPDPCIVLDHRSAVIHQNAAAARQFPGLVADGPLILSLRAPVIVGALDAVRRSGEPQTVELHQSIPTETWHRVTVAPLRQGDGRGVLILTLHSLTDEKRLETLRTDFVANASHELRTPLTSLLGFIDTLTGPAARDPAAQSKFLGIMRTQAIRMSKLIDDLLSLSRIEMRQHMRPTDPVDLSMLLREVGEGLETQAKESGVDLTLELPGEPAVVTGDRDELYEVFENLIDNALKYGAEGGKVEIALSRVSDRPGYDYLATVADRGAGIEAEHVPRLTERFYRVDAESSRKKKGTGLGLAIVKHIVTRHRGNLTIRSKPGEGTRVEVLLRR
jgi:two-component system phosphate regulon sensor histidine kinase PhoR